MAYLVIRHRVKDYGTWRPLYNEHEGMRRKAGLKEFLLLRSIDDPNELVLLFEARDLGKAQAFIASADLKEVMKKAGVLGRPVVSFLEKAPLRARKAA